MKKKKLDIVTGLVHKTTNVNLVVKSDCYIYLFIFNFVSKDFGEAYHIGVDVAEDDPNAGKFFYGPNVWPPAGNSR